MTMTLIHVKPSVVVRDLYPDDEAGPVWAVMDPACQDWARMITQLGTDAFEIHPWRSADPKCPFLIKSSRLRTGQLILLCRAMADAERLPLAVVYFHAVYGAGFSLPGHCLRITNDPEEGREFWRRKAADGEPACGEGGGS